MWRNGFVVIGRAVGEASGFPSSASTAMLFLLTPSLPFFPGTLVAAGGRQAIGARKPYQTAKAGEQDKQSQEHETVEQVVENGVVGADDVDVRQEVRRVECEQLGTAR
jgi:hypothetical protein